MQEYSPGGSGIVLIDLSMDDDDDEGHVRDVRLKVTLVQVIKSRVTRGHVRKILFGKHDTDPC